MSTPCERDRMSSPSQLGVLETPHHPEVPLQACFKLRNAWKNLSGYRGENPHNPEVPFQAWGRP